nr:MAG TPA: hypothetical protein [Caudoviricetes sp.]
MYLNLFYNPIYCFFLIFIIIKDNVFCSRSISLII